MLFIDRDNIRDGLIGLAITGAVVLGYSLLFAAPAHAQLAVSDAPAEASLADMDTVQEPGILQQSTNAATSLTTAGGAGAWQSLAPYYAQLNNNLASGIPDANTFAADFPGFQLLPPDVLPLDQNITTQSLNTYAGALTIAQTQLNDLGGEDSHLSGIEACNHSVVAVLQAIQCNTEAQLAVAQREQMNGQLLATLLTVETVKAAEELDERAQAVATSSTSLTTAATQ